MTLAVITTHYNEIEIVNEVVDAIAKTKTAYNLLSWLCIMHSTLAHILPNNFPSTAKTQFYTFKIEAS